MDPNIPGYKIGRLIQSTWSTRDYNATRESDGLMVRARVFGRIDNEDFAARIEHEIEGLRSGHSPGTPHILELVQLDHDLVLITEDLQGMTTAEFLGSPRSIDAVLTLIDGIATTLVDVHARGLLHQNISANSIRIHPETGIANLTSWGIDPVVKRECNQIYDPWIVNQLVPYASPERTGRIGRGVGGRSGLESLGVVSCGLLRGRRPFDSTDPLELIHAHLAIDPPDMTQLCDDVPLALAKIVARLLEKSPERRYQTARGLVHDIATCRSLCSDGKSAAMFELGTRDVPESLQLPHFLYGRETERKKLLDAFESINEAGLPEVVLISGEAGVGKTALIQEIHRPIAGNRGYFVSGKFDQLNRDVACAALIQALRQLTQQLLAESPERVEGWRAKIQEAVGLNGQLITSAIPEVEHLIGAQPAVQDLGPVESQNRLERTYHRFVRTFAYREHPLVIFLDDLQWADQASLDIICGLLTDPETQHLMFIGAFRDNEVDASHPTQLTLARLTDVGVKTCELRLAPIRAGNVAELIADTFACPEADVVELARLVHHKTQGNPFFVRAFLRSMYEQNLLHYMPDGWQWDIDRIRDTRATENVITLLAERIRIYSPESQRALFFAAALGNVFALDDLAAVLSTSRKNLLRDLQPAIAAGLLLRTGGTHRFVHDRVQEACYSLIADDLRASEHLEIARRLHNTYHNELGSRIYEVANHFKLGLELVNSPAEHLLIAKIELQAGQLAKSSAAFEAARSYFRAGRSALPADSAKTHPELWFELGIQTAECDYLCGEFARGASLTSELLVSAQTDHDRARAYILLIVQHANKGEWVESAELGLVAMQKLGIEFPSTASDEEIQVELDLMHSAIGDRTDADLMAMPAVHDQAVSDKLELFSYLVSPFYVTRQDLYFVLVARMVRTTVESGYSDLAPVAFVMGSVSLIAFANDYQRGEHFCLLADRLLERAPNNPNRCKAKFSEGSCAYHWRQPHANDTERLLDAYRSGLEHGDLLWGGYAAGTLIFRSFSRGEPVATTLRELDKYFGFLNRTQSPLLYAIRTLRQVLRNLRDETPGLLELDEPGYDGDSVLQHLRDTSFWHGVHMVSAYRAQVCLVYDRCEDALRWIRESDGAVGGALGQVSFVEHYFLHALTLTTLAIGGHSDRKAFIARAREDYQKLTEWADNSPQNYTPYKFFIAAQLAQLDGEFHEAAELFDLAIEAAHQSRSLCIEAMANEWCGRLWLKRGRSRVGAGYLQEAYDTYHRWGSTRKTRLMRERYESLLAPIERKETTSGKIDFATVLKSSHAIAEALDLDGVIDQVMRVAMEYAGASRGIIMLQQNDALVLAGECRAGGEFEAFEPVLELDSSAHLLPLSVTHFVANSSTPVILGNASGEGAHIDDSYIQKNDTRSILCFPVLKQGRMIAILYLENPYTERAFSEDQLEVLHLLSGQVATAIDNATLYDSLRDN